MSKYDHYVSFWDKRRQLDCHREIISLTEYAKRNFLTQEGAYRRLCRRKIEGFKSYGRWWIYVEPPNGG